MRHEITGTEAVRHVQLICHRLGRDGIERTPKQVMVMAYPAMGIVSNSPQLLERFIRRASHDEHCYQRILAEAQAERDYDEHG